MPDRSVCRSGSRPRRCSAMRRSTAVMTAPMASSVGLDNGAPFVAVTNAGVTRRTPAGLPVAPGGWHHLAVTASPGLLTPLSRRQSRGEPRRHAAGPEHDRAHRRRHGGGGGGCAIPSSCACCPRGGGAPTRSCCIRRSRARIAVADLPEWSGDSGPSRGRNPNLAPGSARTRPGCRRFRRLCRRHR